MTRYCQKLIYIKYCYDNLYIYTDKYELHSIEAVNIVYNDQTRGPASTSAAPSPIAILTLYPALHWKLLNMS